MREGIRLLCIPHIRQLVKTRSEYSKPLKVINLKRRVCKFKNHSNDDMKDAYGPPIVSGWSTRGAICHKKHISKWPEWQLG